MQAGKQGERRARRSYSYRNLDVWQQAQELALEVVNLAKRQGNTPVLRVILPQMLASASSVGANIAEGHGRYTPAAYRSHLLIARGSVCETDSWLDLLKRAGYLDAHVEAQLRRRCESLLALLTAKVRELDELVRDRKGRAVREEREEYILE